MWQLLYVIAFVIIAVLAIRGMIRNLMALGVESQRHYAPQPKNSSLGANTVTHPELLDESGRVINEPLLVMRSMTVEDAREQLDALYNSSPSAKEEL
ncbi:MAG: DUF2973 domain-containing protein [Thermosynechococcaceae cyanobacterium MS004]|nr:DUF2973 domain-containing protein [Thermosynechococcaceae cyanobacterium MS004]